MSDYRETTVTGIKWRRSNQVTIVNPYQGVPYIIFAEEDVTTYDATVIKENTGCVQTTFDQANQLHIDIYNKLNELYILLREQRDADLLAMASGVPSEPIVP